jgi:NAD(P)-dependent dehydrogenase (short-subunit alcohol dehydrogenase family)
MRTQVVLITGGVTGIGRATAVAFAKEGARVGRLGLCREQARRRRHDKVGGAGPIIAAGGFARDGAMAIVKSGDAGLLAFGRYFTSNPDLPYRLKYNLLLSALAF